VTQRRATKSTARGLSLRWEKGEKNWNKRMGKKPMRKNVSCAKKKWGIQVILQRRKGKVDSYP